MNVLATILLGVGLLSAKSLAQGFPVATELDATARERVGVRFEKDAKQATITVVRWGQRRIPLVRAARTCAVATVRGGGLILLAGGVHDPLDIYFVRQDGSFDRVATKDGRRLGRTFQGGTGSWPLVEGEHLVVFAFQQGTGIELRAMDWKGQVFLARTLPAAVRELDVRSNEKTGQVRIAFGDHAEPVLFRHPLAPRLELSQGLLEFGDVVVGKRSRSQLQLFNRGKRPLSLDVKAPPAGFVLLSEPPRTIAPGKSVRLRLDFAPPRPAAYQTRWEIHATGVVPEHVVRLRGRGLAAAAVAKQAEPRQPKAVRPPAPPQVTAVAVYPRGAGEAVVRGRLAQPVEGRLVLVAGGQRVGCRVARDGVFAATVAVGEAKLQCCAERGARRSAAVDLGTAPPLLQVRAGQAVVRGLPEESFVLIATAGGAELRRWRGRTDATGMRRVDLSILGAPEKSAPPIELRVEVEVLGRTRRSAGVTVES